MAAKYANIITAHASLHYVGMTGFVKWQTLTIKRMLDRRPNLNDNVDNTDLIQN